MWDRILWEEVDRIPAGAAAGENFGWSYYEGTHLYNGGNGNPKPTTRVMFPLAQYPHTPATGPANCAITGRLRVPGPRAARRSAATTCTRTTAQGRIWRRRATGGRPSEMGISRKVTNISSFGQGSGGGLYVISLNGSIYRIGS